ncbi:MAG TPA: hypothetical protein VKE49_06320, partial [Myxococcaceae bacterium]|nr:hypothetical protein [Myxococcaceae bacterium]
MAIRRSQSCDSRRAHSLGIAQQKVHVRRALRPDEDLIGEEALAQANEGEIHHNRRATQEPVAQNFRERRRYPADLLDTKSGVAEKMGERAKSKEPGMG